MSALRRAHADVWFDEELGGGDAWWQMILERIRGCDVFVFAMTDDSLKSRHAWPSSAMPGRSANLSYRYRSVRSRACG